MNPAIKVQDFLPELPIPTSKICPFYMQNIL